MDGFFAATVRQMINYDDCIDNPIRNFKCFLWAFWLIILVMSIFSLFFLLSTAMILTIKNFIRILKGLEILNTYLLEIVGVNQLSNT